MICPRCGESFDGREGPFRQVQRVLHQCGECEIWLIGHISQDHLSERLETLTRTTRQSDQRCPRCEEMLWRFMLSTSEREVDIEACRTCALVVVDHDEVDAAETLLAVSLLR